MASNYTPSSTLHKGHAIEQMVLLTITSSILRSIGACRDLCEEYDFDAASTGPSLDSPKVGDPISHSQIIALSSTLKRKRKSYLPPDIPIHLDELLRGSRVYHEAPRPKAEPVRHDRMPYFLLADFFRHLNTKR